MNKQEFLDFLDERLNSLSDEDREKSFEYYSEMIDERVEDGLTEEEAVAALGSVDEIASRILLDTPLPKLVKAKVSPGTTLNAWQIVLIVLGSPIWLSLIIAAFAVVLAVFIVIWAAALVLYAVVLSLAISAAALVINAFVVAGSGLAGVVLSIGAAVICAALAILLFCGTFYVVKGLVYLSKMIIRGIKYCFI